jgi:hypothetical protein
MGGIAHPWKIFCEPGNLDHGVLIVGYGTSKWINLYIGWGEKNFPKFDNPYLIQSAIFSSPGSGELLPWCSVHRHPLAEHVL